MSYLVLARKWRPAGFDDLAGQEPIMRILKNAIIQGKIAHAYIFSGPRGVGKTSSARILAKALNCAEGPTPSPCGICASCVSITGGSSVDVTEIDGASNNSVDDIRDLRERVKYAPSYGKYKIYIIDEVHMLSGSAFNALLKTLEEPPAHVIFVLATTEMKKIPATVLSRCQHMPFRRISSAEIKKRLSRITDVENIRISPAALSLVARAADGSMRDSLTILDQISSFSSDISEDDVKSLLGITDFGLLAAVATALITGDRVGILQSIGHLSEQGADIRTFTRELVQFFRDLLVASVMKDPSDTLDFSDEEMSAVKSLAESAGEDQLTLILGEIMKADTEVRYASTPRLALEMALIRASFLSSMKPIKEVIDRLSRYGGPEAQEAPKAGGPARARVKPDSPASTGAREFPSKTPSPPPSPSMGEGNNIPPPVKKERDALSPPPEGADEFVSTSRREDPIRGEVVDKGPDDRIAPRTDDAPDVGPPAATAADISGAWQRMIDKIDHRLSSKLSQVHIELKGLEVLLTLNDGTALFVDSIKENLGDMEKLLSEEYGAALRIRVATASKKVVRKKDLKEKTMEDPLIKEALELFDGRIVEVMSVDENIKTKSGGNNVQKDAG
ncbi:MAG: DNA polymerase III subunit gamma/tau [Nitrospirae bacterium]|nr:DNA polymerase III subunit gamma/tau [Nitrospirota bacterium]